VSTWRAKDLCRIVAERFGVRYSENGMLRLLHDLDLSWQKARPLHLEAEREAQEAFTVDPNARSRSASAPWSGAAAGGDDTQARRREVARLALPDPIGEADGG